jgi:hypothetical protein
MNPAKPPKFPPGTPFPSTKTYSWEGIERQFAHFWLYYFNPRTRQPGTKAHAAVALMQSELSTLVPKGRNVSQDDGSLLPLAAARLSGKQVKRLFTLCAQQVGWFWEPNKLAGKVRALTGASIIEGDPEHRRCRKCDKIKPTNDFRAAVSEAQRRQWNWVKPADLEQVKEAEERVLLMERLTRSSKVKNAMHAVNAATPPTVEDLYPPGEKSPLARRSRRFYYTTICAACRSNKSRNLKRRARPKSEAARRLRAAMNKVHSVCNMGMKRYPEDHDANHIFYRAKATRILVARERLNELEEHNAKLDEEIALTGDIDEQEELAKKKKRVPSHWRWLLTQKYRDSLEELFKQTSPMRRPIVLWDQDAEKAHARLNDRSRDDY